MTHLLFLCAPTGYGIDEREGDAPEVGSEIEESTGRFVVTKVAASPLPGDSRRCAYLQPA